MEDAIVGLRERGVDGMPVRLVSSTDSVGPRVQSKARLTEMAYGHAKLERLLLDPFNNRRFDLVSTLSVLLA